MRELPGMHCLAIPAVVCIILAAGLASQKEPDLLVGMWDVQLSQGSSSTAVEFSVKSGKLTGQFRSVNGIFSLANVDFDGKRLAFSWIFKGGESPLVMSYEATLANDRMTGTWWSDDVSSQAFAATKREGTLGQESSSLESLGHNSAVSMSTKGYSCF